MKTRSRTNQRRYGTKKKNWLKKNVCFLNFIDESIFLKKYKLKSIFLMHFSRPFTAALCLSRCRLSYIIILIIISKL